MVINEKGNKVIIEKENLRRIWERFINADKSRQISYTPQWKVSGRGYKATPCAFHVLRYWWKGKTPEVPGDISGKSLAETSEDFKILYNISEG